MIRQRDLTANTFFAVSLNYIDYNPHIPNNDAISGALLILRIQFEYTQTQCYEGARDGIDIWYMWIICEKITQRPNESR